MTRRTQSGAVLLEGLISILIFSVGILALVGLQAVSIKNTTQSKIRIDASLVANQRLGQIWVDIPNITSYNEEDTTVTSLPGGKRTTVIDGDQVTVTVTWQMPGDPDTQRFVTIARINANT